MYKWIHSVDKSLDSRGDLTADTYRRKVRWDQVPTGTFIHLLWQKKTTKKDEGGVCRTTTHYPMNPAVSAVTNSLEQRTLSPSLTCDNTAIHGNFYLTDDTRCFIPNFNTSAKRSFGYTVQLSLARLKILSTPQREAKMKNVVVFKLDLIGL